MKKTFCKFLLSILLGIAILIHTQIVVNAQEKIIAIVYDNSSSMTFVERTGPFITRWAEADYAIRAFATCMDEGDKILLYTLNSNEEKPYEIAGIEDLGEIDNVSKIFYENTPYDNVDNAIGDLEGYKEGEKWLIILTDGKFNDIGSEHDKLQQKLRESLKDDIAVLYVPIGTGAVPLNDDNLPSNLKQVESQDGILGVVLECMNEIYHRQELETKTVNPERVKITIDAPLRELFVLLQQEGEETLYAEQDNAIYNEYKAVLESQLKDFKQKLDNSSLIKPSEVSDDNWFQSYNNDTPSYNDDESFIKFETLKGDVLYNVKAKEIFSEQLVTKPIIGNLLRVEWKNCHIHEGNEIVHELSISDNGSVQVYYQLDFGLELEITQNGEIVEENEIQEGEFEVTIYPVTKDKAYRIASDASLLQNVTLTINDSECFFGKPVKMTAVYGSDINIRVIAEDDALEQPVEEGLTLNVKENIYPIQISAMMPEFFDYDLMNLDCIEKGTAAGINLKFAEKSAGNVIPIRDTTQEQLKVECSITYKGLKKNEDVKIGIMEESVGDSEKNVYLYLKEADDCNIYRDVYCTITAYREDAREQSEQTIKLKLDLQAKAAEVSAELLQEEPYTLSDMFTGNAQMELYCNGELIPNSEWKKVEYRALEGDFSLGAFSKEWNWIDFVRWFLLKEEIVPVHKEVIYTRRGVECVTILEGELLYQPVAAWIRIMAVAIFLALVVVVIYGAVRVLVGYCFGKDFKPYIRLIEPALRLDEREFVKAGGRKTQILFPKKRIKLILGNGSERLSVDFPDMEIRKIRGQKAFEVVNGDIFSKLDYKLAEGIIKNGTVVQYMDCIKIVTSEGLHYELTFQKE